MTALRRRTSLFDACWGPVAGVPSCDKFSLRFLDFLLWSGRLSNSWGGGGLAVLPTGVMELEEYVLFGFCLILCFLMVVGEGGGRAPCIG